MNQVRTFKPAGRAQLSLLAPAEKRALIWLAQRLPAWVGPDHLTALGLVSLAAAGLSYCWASVHPFGLVLATFFLFTNWFGDSLDGTLARVRRNERPRYGF